MKIKIKQITGAIPSLIILNSKTELSAKTAYHLAKTQKAIIEEAQQFEELRLKKLEELCEKDKDGKAKKEKNGDYKISGKNLQKFHKEMADLLEQEVEIYVNQISIKEVEDISGLTVDFFKSLDWLFID